jgi:hypothetical protein
MGTRALAGAKGLAAGGSALAGGITGGTLAGAKGLAAGGSALAEGITGGTLAGAKGLAAGGNALAGGITGGAMKGLGAGRKTLVAIGGASRGVFAGGASAMVGGASVIAGGASAMVGAKRDGARNSTSGAAGNSNNRRRSSSGGGGDGDAKDSMVPVDAAIANNSRPPNGPRLAESKGTADHQSIDSVLTPVGQDDLTMLLQAHHAKTVGAMEAIEEKINTKMDAKFEEVLKMLQTIKMIQRNTAHHGDT